MHDRSTDVGRCASMAGVASFLGTKERQPGLTPRAGARLGAAFAGDTKGAYCYA